MKNCLICEKQYPKREEKNIDVHSNVCLECIDLYGDSLTSAKRTIVKIRKDTYGSWIPLQPVSLPSGKLFLMDYILQKSVPKKDSK